MPNQLNQELGIILMTPGINNASVEFNSNALANADLRIQQR